MSVIRLPWRRVLAQRIWRMCVCAGRGIRLELCVTIPLAERQTVADKWRELEAAAFGPQHGRIQRQEMRRAFYAGAAAWAGLMLFGLDADHEPTDLDLEYISQLHDELHAFGKAIEEGKA